MLGGEAGRTGQGTRSREMPGVDRDSLPRYLGSLHIFESLDNLVSVE